jgi:hypothetical protein
MEISEIFKNALIITFFVFVMMVLVDFIETASQRKMSELIKGGQWRQYAFASFLGATPGCLGAFMNVSLFIHGMISFGAIVGGMIATSGDEAFVMLSQFPVTALTLFGLLLVSGIIFAWLTDKIVNFTGLTVCEPCLETDCEHCESDMAEKENAAEMFRLRTLLGNFRSLSFTRFLIILFTISNLALVTFGIIGPSAWNWKRFTLMGLSVCSIYIAMVTSEHYLDSHIWDHIIRRHLFRVFLWSFGALLFIHLGLNFWELDSFVRGNMFWVFLTGALLGIIPESGPHLIFVLMYAEGLIPFSVLLTTSFVQDGHGMLPLLSYSLKDSIMIKLFNFLFGITFGGVLFTFGL